MKKKLSSIKAMLQSIALELIAFPSLAAPAANQYYVSPGGSGQLCTQNAPCGSINQALALAKTDTAGTVYVAPGEYQELVRIDNHGGGTGQYFNVIGVKDANGNRPLITPPGGPYAIGAQSDWLVWLRGSFINFSGFEVAYSPASKGIYMGGSLQHDNIVQDNVVHHIGGTGIWCNGNVVGGPPTMETNCLIQNNTVYFTVASFCQYNTYTSNPVCIPELLPQSQTAADGTPGLVPSGWYAPGYWGPALTCGNTRKCNVIGNQVYDNYGEGIAITANSYGVISDNTVYDNNRFQVYISNAAYNSVSDNLIYSSSQSPYYQSPYWYGGQSPAIGLEDDWLCYCALPTASSAKFPDKYSGPAGQNGHHNQVFNNLVYGGYIGLYDALYTTNAGLKYSQVYNNTFVNAPLAMVESGTSHGIAINNYNSSVMDNIIVNGANNPILINRVNSIKGITFKNNLWDESAAAYALYKELQSKSDVTASSGINISLSAPGSLTAQAFIPPAGSPAYGKGSPLKLTADYFGNPRSSANPTIGAIE